jgi:hypothetical protein
LRRENSKAKKGTNINAKVEREVVTKTPTKKRLEDRAITI